MILLLGLNHDLNHWFKSNGWNFKSINPGDIPFKTGTCWLPRHFFHILITHYLCMAKQICMITKHQMKPMQYAEIHALSYKYNVPLIQGQIFIFGALGYFKLGAPV